MRVKRRWAALAALVGLALTLALALLPLLLAGCGAGSPSGIDTAEQAVPVLVKEAYHGDVEISRDFTGVIEPEMVVNVVHKTGGKVAEVMVKDGYAVQAGELLIRLEAAEISAQVAQAEAAYQLAQAQQQAAASSLADTRALYEGEVVSRQQLEQAETQYNVAEAQLAQAAAALQLARIQLENTFITAPISGIVSGVTVKPGELISPAMPVATINKMDRMEVCVQLTEKDVARVFVGQKVGVQVSAVSADFLEGEVVKVSAVADPRTKTFEMKAALPNEGGYLKAGMSATLRVVVDADRDTVIVPVEAVLTQQEAQVVYIVEEGVAERRPVKTGLENGTAISVLEGLRPGEQVVISGQHYLKEGSRVTVVKGGAD